MKANPVFSLYIPTKLVFGCGEIKKLSSEKLPGKKALVVISSGTSMRKYGYLERVLAQLRLNNVETLVYDKNPSQPPSKNTSWKQPPSAGKKNVTL